MTRKKRSSSLEVAAYHEAGHAVVALLMGRPVHKITIAPEQKAREAGVAGYVKHAWATRASIEWDADGSNRWRVEKDVQVLLAGEIAQRRFAPRSIREDHGVSDRRSAMDLLSRVSGSKTLPLYYKMLSIWTEDLLRLPFNWEVVRSLAETLLDERTMSRKRVRQWYRDYREDETKRLSSQRTKKEG
jgi:hypothetical protein